jgi:RPA family protein
MDQGTDLEADQDSHARWRTAYSQQSSGNRTYRQRKGMTSILHLWRGRIVDPTGAFFVTAGQYQPEAAQVLAKTMPPEFIAVIGKPTTYTTKEGNVLTSIRAESMQIVDAYKAMVAQALESVRAR